MQDGAFNPNVIRAQLVGFIPQPLIVTGRSLIGCCGFWSWRWCIDISIANDTLHLASDENQFTDPNRLVAVQ